MSFAHFFKAGLIVFSIFVLDRSPFPDKCIINIFPHCMACLFIKTLMVSFDHEEFLSLFLIFILYAILFIYMTYFLNGSLYLLLKKLLNFSEIQFTNIFLYAYCFLSSA